MYGKVSSDACPLFKIPEYQPMHFELDTVIKQAPHPRSRLAPPMPEDGVLLTSPCKDTNERVMAELRVFNGVNTGDPILYGMFDPIILCKCLECLAQVFEMVKCSKELGYGRADTGDMSITILQDGRINMRRVLDRNHVVKLFSQIERALFGSMICNSCGRDLLSILLDDNLVEGETEHEILRGGSTLSLDRSIVGRPPCARDLDAIANPDTIRKVVTGAIDLFERALETLIHEDAFDKVAFEKMASFVCNIVTELFNVTNADHATLLLKILALIIRLEDGLHGINEIAVSYDVMTEEERNWVRDHLNNLDKMADIPLPDPHDSHRAVAYAQLIRLANVVKLIHAWESET